jgi:signal transduction histidine kinase
MHYILCFLQKMFWEESWFGYIIALVVLIAVILLTVTIIRLIKSIPSISSSGDLNQKENQKLKSEISELIEKNNELEKHIAKKEQQIKRLQKATAELANINKDLKEQAEKLDSSNREVEKLQDKKDELLKLKEEFIGAIVHDLKNPVGIIRGFAELLTSYDLSRQEQQSIIQAILETSDKMVVLSEEMTKLIVLEAGDLLLNKHPIPVRPIIDNVIKLNTPNARKKEIIVQEKLSESLPFIVADSVRIEEVIDNLVNNAIKYTSVGGRVEIFTELSTKNLIIHVQDNGLGLSDVEIKKVFLPLQKLKNKPTAGEVSSGVGLSLAKKIIEMHGGKIWVKSKIGEGSTFSISIPCLYENEVK